MKVSKYKHGLQHTCITNAFNLIVIRISNTTKYLFYFHLLSFYKNGCWFVRLLIYLFVWLNYCSKLLDRFSSGFLHHRSYFPEKV